MNWIGDFCIFVGGVLLSSIIWVQLLWKEQSTSKALEDEFKIAQDKLLDDIVDYVNEREKAIELQNHYSFKANELKKEKAALLSRATQLDELELKLKETEHALQEKDTAIEKKLAKKEHELKGARGKARRKMKTRDSN